MNLLNWILIGALIIILNVVWSLIRSWWKQRQTKQAGERLVYKTKQPPAADNDFDTDAARRSVDMSPLPHQIHEPLITNQPLIGPKRPEVHKPLQTSPSPIADYISFNLTCQPDSPIDGLRLMQLVNEHGLKLNKAGLFQHQGDDGSIHFKMANIISPGTFDLSAMQSFSTEGLMLFAVRQETKQPRVSWLQMWQLAEKIVTTFAAELKDEQHQPLTEEQLAQFQQRIIQWGKNPMT